MPFYEKGNVRIRYEEAGSGFPLLVTIGYSVRGWTFLKAGHRPMSNADAVIDALRSGYDSLADRVSGFSDEDLAEPSGAAEWDISQVLSHLGSGAEISRAAVQAALDGEPNPGPDFNHAVWDRWNAMTGRERADGFLHRSKSAGIESAQIETYLLPLTTGRLDRDWACGGRGRCSHC